MRIVHVGGYPSPHNVDGINAVIWTTAVEQARLGHQVGLLVCEPPDEDAVEFAEQANIEIIHIPASRWSYDFSVGRALILEKAADIVHVHSVFIPRQATLARQLRHWGFPYVVTPHGGLMPEVLGRGRIKKKIYSSVAERPRIGQAAGIAYITPGGEADIRAFVPDFTGPIRWVPNPVDVDGLQAISWQPDRDRPRLTFLGRYDVYHKGLDRLAEIARHTPDADFQLFGSEDPKTRPHLDVIRQYGPSNLHINTPVYGAGKLEALSRSTMYIQVSRWEALSISILEALALGTPCAISERMSMAEMFRANDLGLVVSPNPAIAALQIQDALAKPRQLQAWSERSRAYAREYFAPATVAGRIIDVYEESLAHYYSQNPIRVVPPVVERDGKTGHTSTGLIDKHQKKKRDAENFKHLFKRRDRFVEQGVDTSIVGDDA